MLTTCFVLSSKLNTTSPRKSDQGMKTTYCAFKQLHAWHHDTPRAFVSNNKAVGNPQSPAIATHKEVHASASQREIIQRHINYMYFSDVTLV